MMKQEDFSDTIEPKLMPGQLLKAAREAQDITVEAVSRHLHLTVPTILSIEEDQYQKMPAPVYVRGYLRRYAQFVKLSPDEVLKAFDQNVEIKSKVLEEIPSYAQKKPISSSHIGIRFLTYGIAIFLLILVGLWWKGLEKNQGNPIISDKLNAKTSTSTPIKLEPAAEPTQTTPTPSSTPLIEKVTPQPAQTPETSFILKPELNEKPAAESKIKVAPDTSLNKTTEKMDGTLNELKEKNLKIHPARQPSNTLDLY